MYPNILSLGILEATHPEYSSMLPVWGEIDLLASGGYKLKRAIELFLPQRPGEDAQTYEFRLKKFTYLNILASAIGDVTSKLSNSSLVVSGADVEEINQFRTDTNLSGRDEKTLLAHLLREALKFKKVYLHIDKTRSEITPLNKAQEELLKIKPYITTYSPFEVINWSESKGKPQWIKVRQVITDTSNPLLPPSTKVIWTFIDSNYIARYEASNVELDNNGAISKIEDENVNDDTNIPLVGNLIAHGLGEIPVVKLELPDEMWLTDQAAAKALEHLRTDCAKYDLLTFAYFQRTYKKVQTPDSDFEESFADSESGTPPTGLQYVLELDKFEWSEPQGHIIPHLMDALKQIEGQVKTLLSQGGVSAELGVVAQSGESKRMDFVKEETLLRFYGQLLSSTYQKVLQLVAKSVGYSPDLISVTGLNEFENDTLESQISKLISLSEVDFNKLRGEIPATAYSLIYTDLISKATGNLSAEQQEQIKREIEAKLREPIILDTPSIVLDT